MILQVLCGHCPFVEIASDDLAANGAMDGVRPGKPNQAVRLGFTEDLWRTLEKCWEGDRSKRPGVDEILPHLNGATMDWYVNTVASKPGAPAAQTNQDPAVSNDGHGGSASLQVLARTKAPTRPPTSLGMHAICQLQGCNKRVLVDLMTILPSEYCSQRHRE